MMKTSFFVLFLFFISSFHVSMAQDSSILKKYEWKNRLLLLFSPTHNTTYQQQLKQLNKHKADLTERDLIVFYITEKDIKTSESTNYTNENKQALLNYYKVNTDTFFVILIGKDGTQKIKQNKLLSIEQLFGTIDAMPMRRREMNRKSEG
ncbi:DUF4174 domain-containing protein [Porifericola rhodea]|uniref:DUF4174 domain-containing protein n=1 Tax=Porifericola rhodea TaxID=930972 RepID=UPI00266691EA|nr:DUF4174 domain-containing protein [Porifericola rhodea]WKN32575.1 DUF4174 domain-containing protein [Porifericola rhodea]